MGFHLRESIDSLRAGRNAFGINLGVFFLYSCFNSTLDLIILLFIYVLIIAFV